MNTDKTIERLRLLLDDSTIKESYERFIRNIDYLKSKNRIIIYGAGGWGIDVYQLLQSYNIEICAFIDRNADTIKSIKNVLVHSLNDEFLNEEDKDDTLVIISTRVDFQESIKSNLKNSGYNNIMTIDELWYYNCWSTKIELQSIVQYKSDILNCVSIFEDAQSLATYESMIETYITRKYNKSELIKRNEQYFPKDIKLNKGYKRFIDCGAFNGDTLLVLSEKIANVDKIASFEPDTENFLSLSNFLLKKEPKIAKNIYLFPVGVWDITTKLYFNENKGASSSFSDDGEVVVQCVCLDDVLINFKPSFIKMDIEGAELNALLGAEKIIKKYKPDLAISVYHEIDHLWRIPLYINSLNLGYKLYLRPYENYNQETILYATTLF